MFSTVTYYKGVTRVYDSHLWALKAYSVHLVAFRQLLFQLFWLHILVTFLVFF